MGVLTSSFVSVTDVSSVLWMIAAVVLLAIAAIGALVLFNRKLAQKTASQPDSVFTLDQLRQMYEVQKIIQENRS
jgi:hypothetical protein